MEKGQLFVISAPSGAGKTSLVKALLQSTGGIQVSVSHTTRAPRPAEVDGTDYHFVSQSQFEQLVAEGVFLEHAHVFGKYYGTSSVEIDRQLDTGIDVILEIDWQGAQQVRQLREDVCSIFIVPPSLEALDERLRSRGQDDADTVALRMREARSEMSHVHEFDYVIINDQFDEARGQLASIIAAHRMRYARQFSKIEGLLKS